MRKIYVIKNIKGGPWKVRFKLGTPQSVKSKIKGVLNAGALLRIPPDVADYINEIHLKTSRDRGAIAFREIVIENIGPPPITKLVNRPLSTSKKVLDKKKETLKKKETKVSSGNEKEGK